MWILSGQWTGRFGSHPPVANQWLPGTKSGLWPFPQQRCRWVVCGQEREQKLGLKHYKDTWRQGSIWFSSPCKPSRRRRRNERMEKAEEQELKHTLKRTWPNMTNGETEHRRKKTILGLSIRSSFTCTLSSLLRATCVGEEISQSRWFNGSVSLFICKGQICTLYWDSLGDA